MRTELKNRATAFGVFAKDYQKYRRSYDRRLYKLLFSVLKNKEVSILDVGCGTGKSTEPVLTNAGDHKVTLSGIDPDEAMLGEARKSAKKNKLSIEYLQGKADKLPFEKETFDAVISGAAFHWFGDKRSMAQIRKVLKTGGVFFVFWTQYVKSNKPVIGSDIYKKYSWKVIPKKFRAQAYVSGLLTSAGFRNVNEAMIAFSEKTSIEGSLGLIKTNSTYSMMSPATRKSFMREMTAAYKKAIGTKKAFINKEELRICYGFK